MDAIDAYLDEVQAAIGGISRPAVRRIVDALETIWATDGTTFLIGNAYDERPQQVHRHPGEAALSRDLLDG
jgi:hypothetical protein